MRNINITTLQFPEIKLQKRDAHKLRGFFGDNFREFPELHNHLPGGAFNQKYPVVQYKIMGGTPTVIGVGAGSRILTELAPQIENLRIDDRYFQINSYTINRRTERIGLDDQVHHYRFESLWMALNSKNYQAYNQAGLSGKQDLLSKILVGNILMFLGDMDVFADRSVIAVPQLSAASAARFKHISMTAFRGGFMSNVLLADGLGLGKSVARGFGAIRRVQRNVLQTQQILGPRFDGGRPKFHKRSLNASA